VKTGSAIALKLRDPMAWPFTARRAATIAGVGAVFILTVWSAILTKQSRTALPLLKEATVAVGEPTLPGDRLAGVTEVSLFDELEEATEADLGQMPIPQTSELPPMSEEMLRLCSDPAVRWFNGRPVKPWKTITMTVTAYSPDARSCGDSADGLTATLHSVETNNYQLVAADPKLLPYGSMLTVPGYANNEIVPVLDCGGAIKGNRLDLLFPTHEEARRWGVKKVKVIVWQYVDGKPADNPRKLR
jgi:3D (Asp-Asp-Asp) domain-containing protein